MNTVCISCRKDVDVPLVSYGLSFIATCPLCKRLALSISAEEKREIERNQKKVELEKESLILAKS